MQIPIPMLANFLKFTKFIKPPKNLRLGIPRKILQAAIALHLGKKDFTLAWVVNIKVNFFRQV